MSADIVTLGLVILDASRFPHLEGLDNPACSAVNVKNSFQPEDTCLQAQRFFEWPESISIKKMRLRPPSPQLRPSSGR
jgi:hypothetical protein